MLTAIAHYEESDEGMDSRWDGPRTLVTGHNEDGNRNKKCWRYGISCHTIPSEKTLHTISYHPANIVNKFCYRLKRK